MAEAFLAGLIGFLIGKGIPREDAEAVVKGLQEYLGFEPPVGLTGYSLQDIEKGKKLKSCVVVRGKSYDAVALEDIIKHSTISVLGKRGAYLEVAPTIESLKHIIEVTVLKTLEVIKKIELIKEITKVRGLHWYDRNPATKGEHYIATGLAPHTLTKRLEYICPENKIAMVELLTCRNERMSQATTVDRVDTLWSFYKTGVGHDYVLVATQVSNVIGNVAKDSVGTTLILMYGDRIEGRTADYSEGGTCYHYLAYKATEFDV